MTMATSPRMLLAGTALLLCLGVPLALPIGGALAADQRSSGQPQQQNATQPQQQNPTQAQQQHPSQSQAHQPSRSSAEQPASEQTNRDTVVDALTRAHRAALRRNAPAALDQIERAETALLNLKQIRPDPRVDQALLRLDLARTAVNHKDLNLADEQVAAVAHTVTQAFADSTPPGSAPGISPTAMDQGDDAIRSTTRMISRSAT